MARPRTALLFLSALLLSGCGDSSESGPGGPAPSTDAGTDQVVADASQDEASAPKETSTDVQSEDVTSAPDAAADAPQPDGAPDVQAEPWPDGSECLPGTKDCAGLCVSTSSPEHGCASIGCDPCAPPHGVPSCEQGACGVASCDAGWGDCNGSAADGCEANLKTDGLNCGKCGRSCGGTSCGDSQCAPFALASAEQNPYGIAVDATRVYWADYTAGTIRRVAKAGGTPETWIAGQVHPYAVAILDPGGLVYWTDPGANKVARTSTAIAGANDVATNQPDAFWIIADANMAYWTEGTDVARANHVGGGAVVAYGGADTKLGLSQDADKLYWVTGDKVVAAPKPGLGTMTTLASGQQSAWGIEVEGDWVYWTERVAGGGVRRVKKDGTGLQTLTTGHPSPSGIRVRDGVVYWVNGQGQLMSVLSTGGAASTLAATTGPGFGVDVDATHVYWTAGKSVWRIPR